VLSAVYFHLHERVPVLSGLPDLGFLCFCGFEQQHPVYSCAAPAFDFLLQTPQLDDDSCFANLRMQNLRWFVAALYLRCACSEQAIVSYPSVWHIIVEYQYRNILFAFTSASLALSSACSCACGSALPFALLNGSSKLLLFVGCIAAIHR